MSGSFKFVDTPTESQIVFTYFGSTDHTEGPFTIDLSNFSTADGSTILDIKRESGNLGVGNVDVSWDAADGDATFTGTSAPPPGQPSGFGLELYDGEGINIVFDVTETAAATPEPASFLLGGLGLAGLAIAGIRRKRKEGSISQASGSHFSSQRNQY